MRPKAFLADEQVVLVAFWGFSRAWFEAFVALASKAAVRVFPFAPDADIGNVLLTFFLVFCADVPDALSVRAPMVACDGFPFAIMAHDGIVPVAFRVAIRAWLSFAFPVLASILAVNEVPDAILADRLGVLVAHRFILYAGGADTRAILALFRAHQARSDPVSA